MTGTEREPSTTSAMKLALELFFTRSAVAPAPFPLGAPAPMIASIFAFPVPLPPETLPI